MEKERIIYNGDFVRLVNGVIIEVEAIYCVVADRMTVITGYDVITGDPWIADLGLTTAEKVNLPKNIIN